MLGQVSPTWYERVSPATLHIESYSDCLLAQAFGDGRSFIAGKRALLELLDDTGIQYGDDDSFDPSDHFAVRYGFDTGYQSAISGLLADLGDIEGIDSDGEIRFTAEELTSAWRRVIAACMGDTAVTVTVDGVTTTHVIPRGSGEITLNIHDDGLVYVA